MTAQLQTIQFQLAPQPVRRSRVYWAASDAWELTMRSLRHIRQDPEQLVSVTVQPVILVIMFRYLFGGAINTGSESYVDYLMAGIFIETAALTATTTGTAVAADLLTGTIDRFRSLPMAKSAVLTGHVLADLARSLIGLAVLVVVGLLVGFRPSAGLAGWLAAIGVTLLATFCLSWISAAIGLLGDSVEAVQQFSMVLILPIFLSSAFVPTQTMPGWLRVVADNQPMTQAVDAVRALLLGQPVGHYLWSSLLWFAAIFAVAFPLANLLLRRKTAA
jgi:ABC-2 type transport system permease protein